MYLPIKDRTTTSYKGDVYNLEVEHDHSYVAEFAAVHNCWTPWFAMYGSKSGFDSIADAFGPYADRIYAVETGLSSNPAMNGVYRSLIPAQFSHSPMHILCQSLVARRRCSSFPKVS